MRGAAHREASTGDGMPRRVFFVLVELTALGAYLLSVVTAAIGSTAGAAAGVIFGRAGCGNTFRGLNGSDGSELPLAATSPARSNVRLVSTGRGSGAGAVKCSSGEHPSPFRGFLGLSAFTDAHHRNI